MSLFKACAELLASENASRLNAMQRAEKNIDDLLDDLSNNFYYLRQSSIDEELFDVVAGFEAMKRKAETKTLFTKPYSNQILKNNLMKKIMKALVYGGPGKIELKEI